MPRLAVIVMLATAVCLPDARPDPDRRFRSPRSGGGRHRDPRPADATDTAFNRESYRSGDILPNSGHLRVTVAPEQVTVDYVRARLRRDETRDRANASITSSYTVSRRK